MNWAGKQHPVEAIAEWGAPALLAGAAAWSAWSLGQAGPVIGLVIVLALLSGMFVIRIAGRTERPAAQRFEPVPFDVQTEEPGELLLDDPLVEIPDNSRVVRLFAHQESTPGELVLRIEDFLEQRPRTREEPAIPCAADAGEALQAALANIRASLR